MDATKAGTAATSATKAGIKPAVKTEPDAFHPIESDQPCVCCGARALRWRSDYPSAVQPFAAAEVLWCAECGAGFVPGAETLLQGYYEADYAASNRGDREIAPATYFSTEYRLKSPRIGRYFSRAQHHVDLLHAFNATFGDVLDFGSGPGYFLHVADPQRKYGFEPDNASAKYLRHIGARRLTRLEEIEGLSFDAIVSSHSLEHLVGEALVPTAARLVGALKPGGKLLVEVPQGGHSYLHLDSRNDPHTIFFTPAAIVAALERAGARVLYRHARSKTEAAPRFDPIYTPRGGRFATERRGALTLVAERAV